MGVGNMLPCINKIKKKKLQFCIYNSFSVQTIVISTTAGTNITTSTRHNKQSALVIHHTYFATFTSRYTESNIYNMFIIPPDRNWQKTRRNMYAGTLFPSCVFCQNLSKFYSLLTAETS